MRIGKWLLATALIFCYTHIFAQGDELDTCKENILKRVDELFKKEAEKLIKEIQSLVREKLAEIKPLAKPAKPEEEEFEKIEDQEEALFLFDEAMEDHNAQDYDSSIKKFKQIFYSFPDDNIGYTSAYNVACGYALKGDKKNAIEWLKKSIEHGFDNFEHMQRDTDLDSIRDEPGYKEILKKYVEEEDE